MFEIVVFAIGAIVTVMLACVKYAAYGSLGWWGVFMPLIVAVVIGAIKHGGDFSDLIPD